jgi:hypothetical protein
MRTRAELSLLSGGRWRYVERTWWGFPVDMRSRGEGEGEAYSIPHAAGPCTVFVSLSRC